MMNLMNEKNVLSMKHYGMMYVKLSIDQKAHVDNLVDRISKKLSNLKLGAGGLI